jgi:hypothetical protein
VVALLEYYIPFTDGLMEHMLPLRRGQSSSRLEAAWISPGTNGVFGFRNDIVYYLLTPHFFCLVYEME